MTHIQSRLIDWLLTAETPTIRYLTLTGLLKKPLGDPSVENERRAMRSSGPIPAILSQQAQNGRWIGERGFYTPKYTSGHWSMLLLAELQTDSSEIRFQTGARSVLHSVEARLASRLSGKTHGWECFWANLLRYTVQSGLENVSEVVGTLVEDGLKYEWRCEYNDDRPCAWGAIRTLWAFAALPAAEHNPGVQSAIESGISFLLEDYQLSQANYPTPKDGRISSLWFHLNFPLFYQADILLGLRALAELQRLNHPRAQPALEWLAQKHGRSTSWRGKSPYRSRTWPEMGKPSETDRWVSLQAAQVLSAAGWGVT